MLKTHKDFDDSFAELVEKKKIKRPKLNIRLTQPFIIDWEITSEQLTAAMATMAPSYIIYNPPIAVQNSNPEPF